MEGEIELPGSWRKIPYETYNDFSECVHVVTFTFPRTHCLYYFCSEENAKEFLLDPELPEKIAIQYAMAQIEMEET